MQTQSRGRGRRAPEPRPRSGDAPSGDEQRSYPLPRGGPNRGRLAGEGPPADYDRGDRLDRTATGGPPVEPDGSRRPEDPDGPGNLEVLDRLLEAVDAVRTRHLDELTEPELIDEVTRLDLAMRRLDARMSRATAAISDRHAIRAREASAGADEPGRQRAERRARRQVERELAETQRKNPGEIGRAVARGRQRHASPATRNAYDSGELPPRQASQLADTLRQLDDDAMRDDAESRLLDAAKTEDPTTFGRTCRELLALLDHRSATRAEDRRHERRNASTWTTPDGMTVLNGQWATLQGNLIDTAINAFRRHDAPDENRTPGQRYADAVGAMAEAALRAGEAPTQHGVRPHVLITVPWQAILEDAGVAHLANGDPLPFAHIRRLLTDCGVSRLLMDARSIPVEAGIAVRTVNAGLRKQLLERDKHCRGHGCDIPAQFCQVMHLGVPHWLGGRLSLETAALGCSDHHDKLDNRGWDYSWVDDRPVIHHPDRPPVGASKDPPSTRGPESAIAPDSDQDRPTAASLFDMPAVGLETPASTLEGPSIGSSESDVPSERPLPGTGIADDDSTSAASLDGGSRHGGRKPTTRSVETARETPGEREPPGGSGRTAGSSEQISLEPPPDARSP